MGSMCVHSGPVLPIVQQRTVSHGTEMISNMSKACRRQVRVVVTRMMLATCGLVRRGTIGFAWNFQRFKVKWPGEDKWISWRGKQDHISATYSENDAMYVSLEWARMHDQANTVKSSLRRIGLKCSVSRLWWWFTLADHHHVAADTDRLLSVSSCVSEA